MYPRPIFFLIFLLISLSVLAQSPCQPILSQAQVALNRGDTEQALRKLQDVEICDDNNALIRQRQRLQNAIFSLINEQKQAAIQAREEADAALAQTQKLVDAFYFYDNKYALANKGRFYYMDRKGDKSELPEQIGNLQKLRILEFTGRIDGTVPASLFNLQQLEELTLGSRELEVLPTEIGRLTNLEKLDLSFTQIKSLPPEIGLLRKLTFFDIPFTLQFIPEEILVEEPENSSNWFNFSYYCLFTNEYEMAIAAAKKTLDLNPESVGVETNLVLGYLLNDQWPEAEVIYLKWKGKRFPRMPLLSHVVFLQEIADLEAAGITHPDFAKVRALFEED
jgi:hypothetical protein